MFYLIFSISVPLFAVVIPESNSCSSLVSSFLPKSFGGGTQRSSDGGPQRRFSKAVTRINSPGQRFTATHGISAKVRHLLTLQVDKYRKPLVCADFRLHPHAHRTNFRSLRRMHPHPCFWTRNRMCTRTFFLPFFT